MAAAIACSVCVALIGYATIIAERTTNTLLGQPAQGLPALTDSGIIDSLKWENGWALHTIHNRKSELIFHPYAITDYYPYLYFSDDSMRIEIRGWGVQVLSSAYRIRDAVGDTAYGAYSLLMSPGHALTDQGVFTSLDYYGDSLVVDGYDIIWTAITWEKDSLGRKFVFHKVAY